jgi:hypothetical protein
MFKEPIKASGQEANPSGHQKIDNPKLRSIYTGISSCVVVYIKSWWAKNAHKSRIGGIWLKDQLIFLPFTFFVESVFYSFPSQGIEQCFSTGVPRNPRVPQGSSKGSAKFEKPNISAFSHSLLIRSLGICVIITLPLPNL